MTTVRDREDGKQRNVPIFALEQVPDWLSWLFSSLLCALGQISVAGLEDLGAAAQGGADVLFRGGRISPT